MKKRLLLTSALFALFAFPLRIAAAELTLTNADATRLFVALRAAQPGLSPINTRNAALDINTLRPFVEAFEAGQQAVQRRALAFAKDPEREAKTLALAEEAQALARQPIKLTLAPLAPSDDEIKDAKITPDSLAEIIRFLAVAETKVAKK